MNKDVQTQPQSPLKSILDNIYRTPPNIVSKYPKKEGQRDDYVYYGVYKEFGNPLLNLEQGIKKESFRDYVTVNARPTWYVTPDLVLKGQVGYRLSSGLDRSARKKAYQILDYWNDSEVANFGKGNSEDYPDRSTLWIASLNIDYTKKFSGGHSLNVLAGWHQESEMRNTWNDITMLSFYGKAFYSYREKYLFEVSVRQDGSSLFDRGHKWATFPSVALGLECGQGEVYGKSRLRRQPETEAVIRDAR